MCEEWESYQFEEQGDDLRCISDICLIEPYSETEPCCATDDPFSGTNFRENFNDSLPFPSKFSRSEFMPSIPIDANCCRGAIVSLLKPHKILAVAPDISSITNFSSGQICGRSINVLFGPDTDFVTLNAAIKNTAHGQSSTFDTILFTSTGADLHVTATLSPYHRTDRSLGGCLIQIDCIHLPDMESSEPVFILDDFGLLCGPAPHTHSTPDNIASFHTFRELNLAIGLEREAERRWRQKALLSANQPVTSVLLQDDFGLPFDPSTSSSPSLDKHHLHRRIRRQANLAAGLVNEAERRRQQQGSLLQAGGPASA
jgi:hypothetical protein